MSRFSIASREAVGQVGTYPTRNFATLGTFVTSPKRERLGRFLFRLALYVAVEVGPYLHLRRDVWRMASEDSVNFDSLSC
jgi:hypothetical protein